MGYGWLVGAFAFWILCGGAVMVAIPAIRPRIFAYSRRGRAGIGLALLLLSGVFFIGGLFLLTAANGDASPGWGQIVAISLGGALFVATQALAAAFLLSIAHPGVTTPGAKPSIIRNPEGNEK